MVTSATIEFKSLGMKVKVIRESRRLSQVNLALMAHVTQTVVSRMEHDLQVDEASKNRVLKMLDINE